ncbi:hypothetical protein C8A03DRAFT_33996 [Achaetomium macrosporum]|uniref:Short chain oxidoreductase/dehydrogenase n=1 Tax=Achaetomium macrosporum TaxID=79813 RepID=A0AAN7HFA3_9PEZI|nr:hypothetical protein C8A03DRAFT_33996 [Achaetomium macrosporum]
MPTVWFITGASNGFGLLLSLRALKAGHNVIATMRNKTKAAQAAKSIEDAGGKVLELDLTEPQASIAKKVQDAEAIYGKIDVLVNNAGYSLLGPIELFTEKEANLQIQTNLFGPLYTIQAALPGMRARRSGTIVNVSSVAGQDGLPTCGLYAASKFALEGLSESLSREVAEFGISVLIVEPGGFRTNFLAAMVVNEKGLGKNNEYQGTQVHKTMKMFEDYNGKQQGDPEKAAERILGAVTGEGQGGQVKGKVLRLPLGKDAFDRITKKVDKVKKDLETTQSVACSTDI